MGIFKLIKRVFRQTDDIDSIRSAVKAAPIGEFEGIQSIQRSIVNSIDDASIVRDGDNLLVGGRNIEDVSFDYYKGDINTALRDLGAEPVSNATANTFSQTVTRKYPQPTINRNNLSIDAERPNLSRLAQEDQNLLNQINNGGAGATNAFTTIDRAANVEGTFWNKLWTRSRTIGKISLLVGGITVAGLALSDIIKTVNAVNNGCYLSTYRGNGVVTQRILGYTCGSAGVYGDQVYTDNGLTPALHPASSVITTPLCSNNEKDCMNYCDPEQMNIEIKKYMDEFVGDNIYVFCKHQTFSDSIVDIGNGIGSGIGDIIGGTLGGFFGSFGTIFWIILIIAALILAVVLVTKFVPSRAPAAAVT